MWRPWTAELYGSTRQADTRVRLIAVPKRQVCSAHDCCYFGFLHLLRQSALTFSLFEFSEQLVCEVEHAVERAVVPGANRNQQFLFRSRQGDCSRAHQLDSFV